jgi:transposase
VSAEGELVDEWASPPDADGLRGLAARAAMQGGPVRGVIESMNGARFVHDRLEEHGWDVLIADATKVKGLAPFACKTDKIDARVLATSPRAISCRRSGRPTHRSAASTTPSATSTPSAAWADNAAPRSPRSTSPAV